MKIKLNSPYNGTIFHPTFALLCDGVTAEMLIPGEQSVKIRIDSASSTSSIVYGNASYYDMNGERIENAQDKGVLDVLFALYFINKDSGPHYI